MKAEKGRNLPENETILEQLNWRYAVKKFDAGKKVSDKDWETLETAMTLAPSSYGLQPYKFAVITGDETKQKLRPACYGQPQVVDCSHLVIFLAKTELDDELVEDYIQRLQEIRGTERETLEIYIETMKKSMKQHRDKKTGISWAQRQAYIALGFLLETAAVLGIDTCPMEGLESEKVDKILGIDGYTASVLCAVGYRAEDDWLAAVEKVRFAKERLIERFA